MKVIPLLNLLRVNHWVKNLVIFLPLFFAGELIGINIEKLQSLILTFIGFSVISSSIYVLNDLIDIEKDRLHPVKCKRPIANNIFTKKQARVIFSLTLLLGLLLLVNIELSVSLIILSYFILNIIYCYYTKKIPIIDVTSISLGFVLRIFVGGVLIGVEITHWIVIMIFLLMFSIALAKRRDDIILNKQNNIVYRESQKKYNLQFIDMGIAVSFSITIMAYILYSVSIDVIERLGSEYIYITSLPVFLGVLRYLQLTIVEEKTGSPIRLIFSDIFLIITGLIWFSIFSIIIYV